MIFSSINDYNNWMKLQGITEKFIDGIIMPVLPEWEISNSIWKCQKAKNYGFPVQCLLFTNTWTQNIKTHFSTISMSDIFEIRKEDLELKISNLKNELDKIADYIILFDINNTLDIEISDYLSLYSTSTLKGFEETQPYGIAAACSTIMGLVDASLRQTIGNMNRRILFANDHIDTMCSAINRLSLMPERQLIFEPEILRDQFGLKDCARNKVMINYLISDKKDIKNPNILRTKEKNIDVQSILLDINNLHEQTLNYINTGIINSEYFKISKPWTCYYEDYPLQEGSRIHQVGFELINNSIFTFPFILIDCAYVENQTEG